MDGAGSRRRLRERLGVETRFLCYPAGRNDAAVRAAARAAAKRRRCAAVVAALVDKDISADVASIDLLLERDWAADVARIQDGLRAGLAPARALPGVADVRVLGAIGVLQLDHAVDVAGATAAALEHGVWIRPFRDLVYVMPPYATADDDLAAVCAAVCAAAAVA